MNFEMIGKISLGKETEKFKPYSETTYDSGWVKRRIMFNAICGDNRHLLTVRLKLLCLFSEINLSYHFKIHKF